MILQTIGYQATAPGATGASGTAFTDDSLTVLNYRPGTKALILHGWARNQVDGFHQWIAPSFSDTTRGIRSAVEAAEGQSLVPWCGPQPVIAQELISTTIAGSAVVGDIEQGAIWIWYEDMPGLSGKYLDRAAVNRLGIRQVTVLASIDTGVAGNWSGAELITADSDLLRANTPYALLGASIEETCLAVGVRAPDWSNVRVGIPSNIRNNHFSVNFFALLSDAYGMPLIPVFNSANRGNIRVDAAHDENDVTVEASLNLVELSTEALGGLVGSMT